MTFFARSALAIAALVLGIAFAAPSQAQNAVTLTVSLKDHQFRPAELQAPAGKAIVIVVKNLDSAPAEFESGALKVEKVVTAGGTITMRIRPLEPGRYRFFDDFHPSTEGYLVVK